MPACSLNVELCHHERSTTAGKASRRAQSKDRYPLISPYTGVKLFSLRVSFGGVEKNSLTPQSCVKSRGILRLRERIGARSAQDDNLRELTTDHWA
jgi:hypothetical protein